jgi:FixJ family two-component response regulator
MTGDAVVSMTPTISIVDDDEMVRDSIDCLIQSCGYRTFTFPSAEDFLQSGQVTETSCLITDLHMPGLGGLELQSRLRAEGLATPIIFVTAYPEDRFKDLALQNGAVGFLKKPFDEDYLLTCIDRALQKS